MTGNPVRIAGGDERTGTAVAAEDVTGTRLERSLLIRADGSRDTTSEVTWLQAADLYCDVRRPRGFGAVIGRCLDELDTDDLRVLATQEAFAGRLIPHPSHVEWTHAVDLQPGTAADEGTLTRVDDSTLIEHGYRDPYVEEWRITATGAVTEHLLAEDHTGVAGLLIRVGKHFGYARARATPISEIPLPEQIFTAASVADARALFDCEVSLGVVDDDDRWIITVSTLPFREGTDLSPSRTGTSLSTRDIGPDGSPVRRHWTIL